MSSTTQNKVNKVSSPSFSSNHDLIDRGVDEWRTARPDIDSSGKEIVGRLIRLDEIILNSVNKALQPFGLSYFEYAVLATLRVSKEPNGLTPNNLLSRLICSSGGLSNLLKRLENRELIQRSSDPKDKRSVRVKLTPEGESLANKAMPAHAQAELSLVGMFNNNEREVLASLLSRMLVGNAPELAYKLR